MQQNWKELMMFQRDTWCKNIHIFMKAWLPKRIKIFTKINMVSNILSISYKEKFSMRVLYIRLSTTVGKVTYMRPKILIKNFLRTDMAYLSKFTESTILTRIVALDYCRIYQQILVLTKLWQQQKKLVPNIDFQSIIVKRLSLP